MDREELQGFCADANTEPYRDYIHTPFSRGDFTYATDGRIMVRVARVAAITRDAKEIKTLEKPLEGADAITYRRLPAADLPGAQKESCTKCDGRGKEHDCPDCECICEACNGSGLLWEKASVSIGGVPFALKYVNRMLTLPEVEIAASNEDGKPLLFRFRGGIGSVMPLRLAYDRHFDPWSETKAA